MTQDQQQSLRTAVLDRVRTAAPANFSELFTGEVAAMAWSYTNNKGTRLAFAAVDRAIAALVRVGEIRVTGKGWAAA